MEATRLQEVIETTRIRARQRVVGKEVVAEPLVGLKYAPSEQAAHIELLDPGAVEDILGQLETEFASCDLLRLGDEVGLVLQCRDLFENRHDAVECILHGVLVSRQTRVFIDPAKRMRRGTATTPARAVNGTGAAQWRPAGRAAGGKCGLSV